MRNIALACAAIALGWCPVPAFAQSNDHAKHHPAATTAAPMADGEVRKVDKDARKLTLKHGPIPNLDMPGMTMVFQVKEPAMLDQVKTGDKVRFAAEKIGGQYTVVKIESIK